MCAHPGVHDVVMRYSSLPFTVGADSAPAPRGLGLKVFDVPGEKLFGNATTQDFTFNNYPTLELRDMPGSEKLGDSLVRNFHNFDQFLAEQAARPDQEVASAPARIPPQAHMVSMPQYSQGGYRFEKHVAKYAVFPIGEEQKKLADIMLQEDDAINVLSENLRQFHKDNNASFSFCIQLLQNLDEQPVEDLGIEWKEDKYPFVQVATLKFEPQDSFDNAFRTWFDDSGVACNPWHGLKTLQPLGGAQRARKVVYAESRKMRLKMNGQKVYHEPATVREVPIAA